MAIAFRRTQTTEPTAVSPAKGWLLVAILAATFCIPIALASGLMAQMSLIDPYSFTYRRVELVWTHAARILSLPLAGASFFLIVSITSTSRTLRAWASRFLALNTVGASALALLGIAWAMEADENGGDWKGLGIMVALLFGVVVPGILALLNGLQFIGLNRVRRQTSQQGPTPQPPALRRR